MAIDIQWNILPDGNLEMVFNREALEEDEVMDLMFFMDPDQASTLPNDGYYHEPPQDWGCRFGELFDSELCNGWKLVDPSQIGALTAAPIIGYGVYLFRDWMDDLSSEDSECNEVAMNAVNEEDTARLLAWAESKGRLSWEEQQTVVASDGMWYYERYQIEDPLIVLFNEGRVVWNKVEEEKSDATN